MGVIAEEQVFNGIDGGGLALVADEYVNCRFVGCRFASADLSGINFECCRFEGCDLSMASLRGTTLHNAVFCECKLLGLRFEDCNRFTLSFSFTDCILNFSSFYRLKLKDLRLERCRLNETDFTETELPGAVFHDCDLTGAVFDRTNVEKADFRTACGYAIHPERNRIRKARFTWPGASGLLLGYDVRIEM